MLRMKGGEIMNKNTWIIIAVVIVLAVIGWFMFAQSASQPEMLDEETTMMEESETMQPTSAMQETEMMEEDENSMESDSMMEEDSMMEISPTQ